MPLPRVVASIVLLGITLGAGAATDQSYPARPIRMVTAEVGGGVDFTARVIAQSGLSDNLGQQVIVDNHGGAGGGTRGGKRCKAAPRRPTPVGSPGPPLVPPPPRPHVAPRPAALLS